MTDWSIEAMSIYEDFKAEMFEIVVRDDGSDGVFDPVTMAYTGAIPDTDYKTFAIKKAFSIRDINGTTIQTGDTKLLFASYGTDAAGDTREIRAGANFSRIMHSPSAPNLLDYLDEKGYMIFGEIPVWGEGDPNMIPNNPLTQQWMREMIERDYNHPCVIGWSVGNELKQHYDYVDSMIQYTRTLDPNRLINYVSFTGSKAFPTNDPITVSDLLMYNTYSGNNGALAENLRGKWPNLPIFFSEFGASQIGTGTNALIPGMDKRFHPLEKLPYVIGISVWTFNDYRSNYKGTPASGNREWGVVTVNRQPKPAYWQMRKLFSPVNSLTVSNGVIRVTPRRPDEIPSYTLRGYKVKWDGGEIVLPDLKPGDPVWTSETKLKPGTAVKLFSPTGYDVMDSF